ncbi:TRAP transporter small permease [Ferrovibrio sp.]|uniref:TRAP transporter small permease n=1 Tax=Ferrovibrio sp. TaxID=1917215 RepID=UPI003D2DAC75
MMLGLLRTIVRYASLALLAALIIMPLLQIVMRGVFNVPMAGAEELARYFLIAGTFIGASYVTVEGGQIRMEELQAKVPDKARWLLQLGIDLCGIATFTLLAVAGCVSIAKNLDNQTATLEMPFWLFMAPLAIGAALLALENAVLLVRTWRSGRAEAKQTTLT